MVWVACLVNKFNQVVHEIWVVALGLDVQLVHLLLDCLLFLLEMRDFGLSLLEYLVDLGPPLVV